MERIIKSIGHGLLAAGFLLIIIYAIASYLRGQDAFHDALDPTAIKSYLALLPLTPGLLVLWLGEHLASRRRNQ